MNIYPEKYGFVYIWYDRKYKRLSEAAKNRPPRSEESKRKAREAQLGKPKNRKSINKA